MKPIYLLQTAEVSSAADAEKVHANDGVGDKAIVSILRHPLEQTLLHYHRARLIESHECFERAQEMDLRQFLFDPICAGSVANLQTYSLACRVTDRPAIVTDDIGDRMRFEDYSVALSYLLRLELIEATTSFDMLPDLEAVSKMTGRNPRDEVDEALAARIGALTLFDQKLYEVAERRAHARIDEAFPAKQVVFVNTSNLGVTTRSSAKNQGRVADMLPNFFDSATYRQARARHQKFKEGVKLKGSYYDSKVVEIAGAFSSRILERTKSAPFFVHIPKCAGSSIAYNLKVNGNSARYFEGNGDLAALEELQNSPKQSKVAFIYGHVPLGMDRCFEGDYDAFSVLRKPSERLFSEYMYMTSKVRDAYTEHLNKIDVSIRGFCQNLQSWQINPSVKFLAGIHPVFEPDEVEALDTAIENIIERMWVVAPLQDFNLMLLLCARRYGWARISPQPRNAAAGSKSALQVRFANAVQPFTFADDALFEIVSEAWALATSDLPASAWRAEKELSRARDRLLDVFEPSESGGHRFRELEKFIRM